jgi:uncharacterized protein (DUF58 family)
VNELDLENRFDLKEVIRLSQLLSGYLSNQRLEGLLNGGHHSPLKGQSLEFAQHREYAPLDDLKHLDWKVFAKSDKYYIKQFEKENHIKAYFCIDYSQSMRFQGAKSPCDKLDYAIKLALIIALFKINQGEGVAGIVFDEGLKEQIPASTKKDYFRELLRLFGKERAWGEQTDFIKSLRVLSEQMLSKGIIFIFTDAFDFLSQSDQELPLIDVCMELQKQGHKIVVLQILDGDELTFPYDELTKFEGFERGEIPVQLNAESIVKAYLEEINAYCQSLKQACVSRGIQYHRLINTQPLEQSIFQILGESK